MVQQDKDTPDIIDRLLSGFDALELLSIVRSLSNISRQQR
jgi:hypothetical protein